MRGKTEATAPVETDQSNAIISTVGEEIANWMNEVEPMPNEEGLLNSTSMSLGNSAPGAYSGLPGTFSMERRERIPKGLVGSQHQQRPPQLGSCSRSSPEEDTLVESLAGLTEAHPVTDTSNPNESLPMGVQAQPVHPKEKQECNYKLVGIVAISALLLLAGILGVIIVPSETNAITHPTPTTGPTAVPSKSPTLAPTRLTLHFLKSSLPNSTLHSLNNFSTPQWKAWNWLEYHPFLQNMEQWKLTQLFALATFFYSMEGNHWSLPIQDNWMLYERDECFWFSSSYGWFDKEGNYFETFFYGRDPCDENGVFTNLILNLLNLTGWRPTIPPEIALLTSLKSIIMEFNGIGGQMQDFIPSEVYHMQDLQILNLYFNAFTGTIPTEIGLLTNLVGLYLGVSSITGTFPTEFGMLSNMDELFLAETNLTGPIPSEIGLLTNTSMVVIKRHSLSGTIPTEIGLMAGTESLTLAGSTWGAPDGQHFIAGLIPSEIGSMPSLTALKLWDNALSGPIPTELALLTGMVDLDLHSNNLTGTIPTELALLTGMADLDLHSNNLTGTIPSQIFRYPNLLELELDGNSFTGTLSSLFGSLTSLEKLELEHNQFNGTIPTEFGLLQNLTVLTLHNNTITGSVPDELDFLVSNGSLSLLSLEGDNLS